MSQKYIKEAVSIVVGKQVESLGDMLSGKVYVNEFIIAKKLGVTINQTRNILYRLSDQGLVSSIRKKDKKKGWYTYFWRIENLKALNFVKEMYLNKMKQLQEQINSRETKVFYICERCNIEFNEANALLHDFTCDDCGSVFTIRDNSKLLKDMRKNLGLLEREVEEIDKEIKTEEEKIEKEKEKETKKIDKQRKKELALKKEARKKEQKKKSVAEKKEKKKSSKPKAAKKKFVKKTAKKSSTKKKVSKKK